MIDNVEVTIILVETLVIYWVSVGAHALKPTAGGDFIWNICELLQHTQYSSLILPLTPVHEDDFWGIWQHWNSYLMLPFVNICLSKNSISNGIQTEKNSFRLQRISKCFCTTLSQHSYSECYTLQGLRNARIDWTVGLLIFKKSSSRFFIDL